MKSHYKFFITAILCLFVGSAANATVWPVTVNNYNFNQSPDVVNVGDTILWTWISGDHTTTSTQVPASAATWNSPINQNETSYMYVVTVPGTYIYICQFHSEMIDTFEALPLGGPCTFIPTVEPTNPMLCPDGSDTLFSVLAADSYQWYQDGNAIAGATNQFYVVNQAIDAGSEFSVEVTIAGCTDTSDLVMVETMTFPELSVFEDANDSLIGGAITLCAGDSVTLTVLSPFSSGIQWSDANGPISGATDSTLTVTESGIYVVTAAPAQCPDFAQTLGTGIEVVVNPPLEPTITPMGNDLMVNLSGMTYQWYLNNTILTGSTNSMFTPTVSGSYTVSVVDANGCSAVSPAYEFIIGQPCNLTAEVLPGDVMLCPNSSDTLFASPAGDSYQWYKNGQPVSGATNAFHVVTSADDAPAYFQVEVTQDTCTDMSDSILVDGWVFQLPFVIHSENGTIDGNGVTHLCAGDTLTLTFNFDTNIEWYNNGVVIPGETSNTLQITETGSYHVSGAPSECPDFVQTLGVTVEVVVHVPTVPELTLSNDTIYANPASGNYTWYFNGNILPNDSMFWLVATQPGLYNAAINDGNPCAGISGPVAFGLVDTCTAWEPVITGNFNLCPGTSETFTATPTGGAYQWYRNGLPIANAYTSTFVVDPFTDDSVTYSVITALDGCIDTSAIVTVFTQSFPDLSITQTTTGSTDTAGVVHLCTGNTLTLGLNAPYDANIQWSNNGTALSDTTSSLVVTVAGSYLVSAAPASCPDYIQTLTQPVEVVTHTAQVPTITQSGDTLMVSQDGTAYQWFFNGTQINGETSYFHLPTQSGAYTVTMTDVNGCTATSAPRNYVGIESAVDNGFALFPNPAADELYVVKNNSGLVEYVVYDAIGKVMKSGTLENVIRVSELPSGLYMLTLTRNEKVYRHTFVKR